MALLRPFYRRLSALLTLLACVGAVAIPAAADPHARLEEIEQRQGTIAEKLEAIGRERSRVLGRIGALDRDRVEAEAQLAILDGRLDRLSAHITEVRDQLTLTQQRLAMLSERLEEIKASYDARRAVFTARAVATYKAGPTAYLDGMLSSETFSDLIDRYTYYESALNADVTLLNEIESLRGEVEMRSDAVNERQLEIAADKRRLEADEAALAQARGRREVSLAALNQTLSKRRALLSSIESQRQSYEAAQASLERQSDSLASILAARASGGLPVGGGQLLWPAAGPVTSGFGYRTHPIFGDTRFHSGIDIGAPYGAPVIAADAGEVIYTGVLGGYGNAVVIDHGGGLATTYNHLSAFRVGTGQMVAPGQLIADVGCTGYCTGPHLHFEVRVNGTPVDPLPYLQ